jgi:hypothetical protein
MFEMWKDVLLILFGGGLLIEFVRFLMKKGGEQQVIKEHQSSITCLQNENKVIKDRIHALEQSTSIRLTAIEVEIKNLSIDIQEISKDVKMILKHNIYQSEGEE